MALLLREAEVAELLTMDAAIEVAARALVAFSRGDVLQPVRQALSIDPHGGYLGLMPAHIRAGGGPEASEALGAKAVTFYVRNAERRLPTHMAVVLLWDPATGTLRAIMDGRLITEVRTAAVSAAATKALSRPEAGVLALLGSGVQARSHFDALRRVRSVREVRVWSRTPAHREAFAREMSDRGVSVRPCATAEEAVRGADLIVTATSSPQPVLEGRWLEPGVHINAVGAPRPDWRELDSTAVARARVFVDSRAGALAESGDLLLPMQEGVITRTHILGEIGEVLAGTIPGRTSPEEITLFKSLGMAVEDVATAAYVYAQALARGLGREVAL
ncbi:MAG: ornithine cyclodeaminase family protein [Armatimonadota bacterium]|nr:ornithine cyclodeaminase family protein [Armatimonadota bacterium]MDR7451741.1 ornithine cyclodeaminase family protein [Armatimonadota bacterium]MDR7467366.1 ornithine cyclodeaminase family protein [Armatimonadota bacterium]MDR7494136.1 ornithine cyclodeaminase family protein [Armatimonadota bacterium]MDR7498898.1 ornithine cyclodeaminase family protein [Armatimonadota bacterium]